jgi:hypothetical protein
MSYFHHMNNWHVIYYTCINYCHLSLLLLVLLNKVEDTITLPVVLYGCEI